VSSANGDLLAGLDGFGGINDPEWALRMSIDGGATWTALPMPPKETVPGAGTQLHVTRPTAQWGKLAISRVAIDPSPEHDPACGPDARLRLLLAGRSGIYEYNAGNPNGGGGGWTVHREGLVPSVHYRKQEPVPWMGSVAYDPRPGKTHIVYAAKVCDYYSLGDWSKLANTNHDYNGGRAFKPLHRSTDGGRTWEPLHAPRFRGLPDFFNVCAIDVGPSGTVYVANTHGLFSLPPEGVDRNEM
jgi:hypothetical protein